MFIDSFLMSRNKLTNLYFDQSRVVRIVINQFFIFQCICSSDSEIPLLHQNKMSTVILNPYPANVGNMVSSYQCWGPRWRSWLRHCATSQKVAGSIPDGVIGIFH